MKAINKLALTMIMVLLAASCGQDNKSGGNNNGGYEGLRGRNGRCSNSYTCSINELNGIDARYNGASIESVVRENYCLSGGNQRMQYTQQVQLPFVVQRNDIYVGVTSFGDVAVVVGSGSAVASFTAFLCPRYSAYGQIAQPASPPTSVSLGVATRCRFKTMFASNLIFNDGSAALFRYLDGGNSQGRQFSVCN